MKRRCEGDLFIFAGIKQSLHVIKPFLMKRSVLALVASLFLFACSNDGKDDEGAMEAKGPVEYGGVFRVNEVENFKDLFPLSITEVASKNIASQIYQGLLKLDQDSLTVKPALAKDWEIKDSAKTFIFHLREGIEFHKDEVFDDAEEREVTAEDFKYCFDKLCEASSRNKLFWLFKDKVKGANKYYESTENDEPLEGGVPGIKVVDEHTLRVELNYSLPGFEKILAHPGCYVWPEEALEKYGDDMQRKAIGTGPFKLKKVKEGEFVALVRNDEYWEEDEHGNQLPYLDGIEVRFIQEKANELSEFRSGNLDMVYRLPVESIDDITGELDDAKKKQDKEIPFKLQSTPSLAIQYYGFQHQGDLFSDKHLRKAFNYAIDRDRLTKFTLEGEGVPATHGIIPPSFKYYDTKKVEGYEVDEEKAREHLKKAGYESGDELPSIDLQLNSGGGKNENVAEAIQSMLKDNLGVSIELNPMPFSQHLERIDQGKTDFWRAGWIADYPDPENFLNLLYGDHVPNSMDEISPINSVRYKSEKFDSLFNEGLRTIDRDKRMELFQKADQVAMDDAAVIPLFYDENMRLIKPWVKNFPMNAMEYRDFTRVYFKGKEAS